MNISAKTEYACLAVLELAIHFGSPEPVRLKVIADKHGIPARFLVQILLQLKGAGMVGSTRGAAGGYQLVRPPAEITLADVMAVIDGSSGTVASAIGQPTQASEALLYEWQKVADVQQDMLRGVNYADLVEQLQPEAESMYYI
ncbi:MAG TPA: Rrf2 family transcriptional regulator [Planctomycetaceae bacterium]|nr:Rrf2 family transcriptional regulator [Planctomycetaceae bacterium]